VLSVRGPVTGALLSGDLPGREERVLVVARGGALGHAVLVSPHHGSAGSSTDAFVAAVGARHVIHAAGHRNRWGFPRPDVVARYRATGARQAITGASGAVRVAVAADGRVTLECWRARDRRVWRQP
jgi:competence protein ComEC